MTVGQESPGNYYDVRMTDRFQRLCDEIEKSEAHLERIPEIWLLLGRTERARWTKSWFGTRSSAPVVIQSTVTMHVPATRAFSDRPVFLAQADLSPSEWHVSVPTPCHQTRHIQISTRDSTEPSDLKVAHLSLVVNYANVVCVFCDDYSPAILSESLDALFQHPAPAYASDVLRPRLVLVTASMSTESARLRDQVIRRFVAFEGDRSGRNSFSACTVMSVARWESEHSAATRVTTMSQVQDAARQVEIARAKSGMLFSAPALSTLWQAHLTRLQHSSHVALNLAQALRQGPRTVANIECHVKTFLRMYPDWQGLQSEGITLLGTILFVDHNESTVFRKSRARCAKVVPSARQGQRDNQEPTEGHP